MSEETAVAAAAPPAAAATGALREAAATEEAGGKENVGEDAGVASVVDFAEVYRARCKAVGCRINSAVVNTLSQALVRKPLVAIILRENYVGCRGVLPIVDLLEANQTVETVDLSHNGLDNASLAVLCRVAAAHKGLTCLDVSHNEFTQAAARHVVALLERNTRLLSLSADGNGFYASSLQRFAVALERNRAMCRDLPRLEQLTPKAPPVSLGGPSRHVPDPSALLGGGGDEDDAAEAAAAAAAAAASAAAVGRGKLKPRPAPPAAASQGFRRMTPAEREEARRRYEQKLRSQSDALEGLVPCGGGGGGGGAAAGAAAATTTPSLAARRKLETLMRAEEGRRCAEEEEGSARASQAAELARRAQVRKAEAERTAAAVYGEDARGGDGDDAFALAGLSAGALEGIAKVEEKIAQAEEKQRSADAAREKIAAAAGEREQLLHRHGEGGGGGVEDEEGRDGTAGEESASPPLPSSASPATAAAAAAVDAAARSASSPSASELPPEEDRGGGERQGRAGTGATPAGGGGGGGGGGGVDGADEAAETPPRRQETASPEATQLSIPENTDATGVQFYELFNAGGRAYNGGRLEDAYQAWVDALEVATVCKNMEWISVINGNIQALSYQLLTSQGDEYLNLGQLDEALKCLQLARDVALKARNLMWERSAESAMNAVRRAQFMECYTAAAACFEPLVQGLESGGAGAGAGARGFAAEWERVQSLKEALETSARALEFASQVTGRAGTELASQVCAAVNVAYECQVATCCAPAESLRPRHAGQNTHLFSAAEREKLISVWRQVQETLEGLQSPEWHALAWSVLGNLHHSLFHNKVAEECYTSSIAGAHACGAGVVEASSLTHLARVLIGLARYSEAEHLLLSADRLWTELRKTMSSEGSPKPPSHRRSGGGRSSKGGGSSPAAPAASPARAEGEAGVVGGGASHEIYAAQQHFATFDLLQQIMVAQYRYREGLEMAERMRAICHMDKLREKMAENFNTNTTSDHMLSLARSCDAVLVVYSVMTQFDWDVDKGEAAEVERLCVWVMPPEGELKFVLVNVTKDFGGASIERIVDELRSALCVDSDSERRAAGKPQSTGVIVDAPTYAWKHPLQQLYDFLIHPISDFLTVTAGLDFAPHRKVTFVPHGFLHLVPWAALMDSTGRFLIESFNIQVSPSVQILAFARLNATKLKPKDGQRIAVVTGNVPRHAGLAYPYDDPPEDEGDEVAEVLGAGLIRGGAEAVQAGMAGARLLHVAAEVLPEHAEGRSWGGLAAADGVLGSSGVEASELCAELVVLPCCNHSKEALMRGGDGVVGMCRAFACAGAPTVVYSLWATPHQASTPLMAAFYACLRSQPDKALCLSQAMRKACAAEPCSPASWVFPFPPPPPCVRFGIANAHTHVHAHPRRDSASLVSHCVLKGTKPPKACSSPDGCGSHAFSGTGMGKGGEQVRDHGGRQDGGSERTPPLPLPVSDAGFRLPSYCFTQARSQGKHPISSFCLSTLLLLSRWDCLPSPSHPCRLLLLFLSSCSLRHRAGQLCVLHRFRAAGLSKAVSVVGFSGRRAVRFLFEVTGRYSVGKCVENKSVAVFASNERDRWYQHGQSCNKKHVKVYNVCRRSTHSLGSP